MQYRSTLEEVAEVFAIVQGYADRAFRAARLAGRREPGEAYLADGLLEAVRASRAPSTGDGPAAGGDAGEGDEGSGLVVDQPGADAVTKRRVPKPPSPAKVLVHIDWDAFIRGWPIDGEVSEIPGLGPVPVSAVRAMTASGDPFLAAVVTRGVDVVNVAHLGRRPTAHQQTALQWRSPQCTALGCNARVRLENDHRKDWATTKITLLSLLDPVCGHHHDLKTYKGWAFVEGTGKRLMVPPDDSRHPRHASEGAPPRASPGAA